MHFNVMTLFPDWVSHLEHYGVIGRAFSDNKLSLQVWNPRDYTQSKHQTIDDRPYGGGPGMVMQYQPLYDCLTAIHQADIARFGQPSWVIYCSPQGKAFNHAVSRQLAQHAAITLIAGRYEGLDERFVQHHVDAEYSVGDFVVSGGELPAMLMIDAIGRGIAGVLGDAESAEQDSFVEGLLDHPHYTRPETLMIDGQIDKVPEVLLSGNHKAIKQWRAEQALQQTQKKRPDLLVDNQANTDKGT